MGNEKKELKKKGVVNPEHQQRIEELIGRYSTMHHTAINLYKFCNKNIDTVEEVYSIRDALVGGAPALISIAKVRLAFPSDTVNSIKTAIISTYKATSQKHFSTTVGMMVAVLDDSPDKIKTLANLQKRCIEKDIEIAADLISTRNCDYWEAECVSVDNDNDVAELFFD
jgi:hypothetical protein